jgi:hypothetical protein
LWHSYAFFRRLLLQLASQPIGKMSGPMIRHLLVVVLLSSPAIGGVLAVDSIPRQGSIKGKVKKKHFSVGRNFSCFAAPLTERNLF